MGLFATRGAATPPNELVAVNGIVDGAATDAASRLLVVVKISAPPPPPPLKDGVAAGAGIGAVNPTIANPPPPPPPPLPPLSAGLLGVSGLGAVGQFFFFLAAAPPPVCLRGRVHRGATRDDDIVCLVVGSGRSWGTFSCSFSGTGARLLPDGR